MENIWKKCEKEWKECEKLMWKFLEKNVEKIGVEKTSINGLEEVKSTERYQCGKKRDKFPTNYHEFPFSTLSQHKVRKSALHSMILKS